MAQQHEETVGALTTAVHEQTSSSMGAVSDLLHYLCKANCFGHNQCLEEMAKLLDAIGDKQQTELVNSLRSTVQDQITLHISYVSSFPPTIVSSRSHLRCSTCKNSESSWTPSMLSKWPNYWRWFERPCRSRSCTMSRRFVRDSRKLNVQRSRWDHSTWTTCAGVSCPRSRSC